MTAKIKLLPNSVRRIGALLCDRHYRRHCWLRLRLTGTRRFKERRVNIGDWQVYLPDNASFVAEHKDIFVKRIYAFKFNGDSPRILDLGANIGLSVLFFKSLYPNSRITAFEADPVIFKYLQMNVHGNGFSDVELINKAAWDKNTKLDFLRDGADGGRVVADRARETVAVEAIDLAEYLAHRQFDFLKMDIEGAEETVLPACSRHLGGIGYVFVEYHSDASRQQCLHRLLNVLAEAGFRLHIHSAVSSPAPFMHRRLNAGFDLQLNIFAWKEPC